MDETLDLDKLAPKPKTVRLNGKVYEVFPAKMNDFILIEKFWKAYQKDKESKSLEDLREVLKPVVPDIEEMNLSFEQLGSLMQLVYSQVIDTTQKKTEETEAPTSPQQ